MTSSGRRPLGTARCAARVAAMLWVAGLAPLLSARSATAQDSGSVPPSTELRPRVTALMRAALADPADSTVWSEMARLLPEMARTGDAGVLETFEAARLADSLAAAPIDPAVLAIEQGRRSAARLDALRQSGADAASGTGSSTTPAAPSAGASANAWANGSTAAPMDRLLSLPVLRAAVDVAPWTLPWILAAGLLLATPLIRRRRARTAVRATATSTPAAGHSRRDDRLWAVTTLAQSGLPPSEIARRTGMAQDAVRVLMEMGSVRSSGATRTVRPRVPAPGATPGAPSRPRTLGERAAGVTAERAALTRQARTMRDGRITYGPGAGR